MQDVLANRRQWAVVTTDVLDGLRAMPDGCVQCVVTSPPYFALRDYGIEGQIGLEETPDAYIAKMVAVFAEVRRVLRGDGCLFLNIGDSYFGDSPTRRTSAEAFSETWDKSQTRSNGGKRRSAARYGGMKPKDLMGIPWSLAFALRADGWYLRSEIIWHKPNPMPESVTDRPTKAHEQIFLLTKNARYFYDGEAVREAGTTTEQEADSKWAARRNGTGKGQQEGVYHASGTVRPFENWTGTRNRRSVWTIASHSFKEAHFATFPPELPSTCLKAGTSAKGCCSVCGAPWRRVTESERIKTRPGAATKVAHAGVSEGGYIIKDSMEVGNRDPFRHITQTVTKGWQASCDCNAELWPCLTLDPFSGAGTTGLVAKALGLRYVGLELNPDYADMARRRIAKGIVESTPRVEPLANQPVLF